MQNVSSSNSQAVNVPKLRFPGFEGEWKTSCIGNFGSFYKGAHLSKADISDNGIPFVLYGELYTTYNEVATEIIRKTEATVGDEYISESGDVIIPTSGETAEDIATATCIMKPGVILAGDLCIMRPNKIDGRFLSYIINHKAKYAIARIAQGKSVVHIRPDEVEQIKVSYPSKSEQDKILRFLGLLSQKIEKQQQLIDSLKLYKRGVLSRLFDEDASHTKRWKKCKIGDYLTSRISKQIPTEDAPLMAFTAEGGVEPKGDRYDRSFLVKDKNKQYKRTEFNDFIYSSNNLDVGSIGLNKYGAAVISDVYEIFEIDKQANPSFISEAIKRPETIYKILKYRQGVTYGQYRIYAEDFQSVDILLPSLEVQNKIAFLIERVDRYISTNTIVLEKLNILKNSLLQKLFV